jgi:hypothetical protein
MTFTVFIALNLSLSILAMLVVYGCLLLAHRLPDESRLDADWRDWGHPLPVALVVDHDTTNGRVATHPAAA